MSGNVQLVGAGPGDPELLTLKALRALEGAEIVVHDRLVSEAILALIPDRAVRFDVGKAPGRHPVPQHEINSLLVRLARTGRRVVRLKGGDPLLFGRGGEEAQALRAAGFACEIVPGITSAQGVAASLCVPLTHRTLATGVRYLTGHRREGAALDCDWAGLADPQTTLVVYMGLATIGQIAASLVTHGRSPATPVLAVSRATQAGERHVLSTLGAIVDDAAAARLESPTLFVIGEVVDLAATFGVQSDACSKPDAAAEAGLALAAAQ